MNKSRLPSNEASINFMIKAVYLIASHKNPEQIFRLVRAIKDGSSDSTIVVHHDFNSSFLDVNLFSDLQDVNIIKNHEQLGWGEFSLVNMTLNAIEWILQNIKFDWLIFISGQDFPIQPIRKIEFFLENTSCDGFISGVSLEEATPCGPFECQLDGLNGKKCSDCVDRYYYQYFLFPEIFYRLIFGFQILKKWFYKVLPKFHSIQSWIRMKNTPFKGKRRLKIGIKSSLLSSQSSLTFYKGSQWFTLNRRCIEYISSYIIRNPEVVAYYKRTIIPDESFFQTILYNCSSLTINKNNKRFISWQNSSVSSPNILNISDYNRIIASGEHFARKFDSRVDSQILDKLEKHIRTYL